ncbi:MAG: hypothetical protein MJ249_11445, partial [Kiritimatiellae bacterium]|nr:hypothetical protein [Kiritimatiellia bacterium]
FQTGFNQPLLAGMFIDKPIVDRNAVQTVSRLNRKCPGKDRVVVVDFTNNADAILRAFAKYREGTPYEPDPPDPERAKELYRQILDAAIFTLGDITQFAALARTATDAQVQYRVGALRQIFQTRVSDIGPRKDYVRLLAKYVKQVDFFRRDYDFGSDMLDAYVFADVVGRQLIKQGSMSELMQAMRHTEVVKASVKFQGVRSGNGIVALKPSRKGHGPGVPQKKVSVQEMIDEIRETKDVLPLVRHFAFQHQEHVLCITLNGANEVINTHTVAVGSFDRASPDIREVFFRAVADKAAGIVIAHNHPEGVLRPSDADIQMTNHIRQVGDIVGVMLLDHIVFNRKEYFSFLEGGLM